MKNNQMKARTLHLEPSTELLTQNTRGWALRICISHKFAGVVGCRDPTLRSTAVESVSAVGGVGWSEVM